MTASDYISAKEALVLLGLYKEGKHKIVKYELINRLVNRGLLVRYGTKSAYKYKRSAVEELFQRHLTEGLCLTAKQKKQAA